MSRLADEIRELVADPSVSDHYGGWGILNPTQRNMIRKLCDLCDIYEKEAHRANVEIERLEKHNTRMAYKHYRDGIKAFAERASVKITEVYNKHIFGNNDLEAEEKDAIINFCDDVTRGLEELSEEMTEETT